MPGSFEVLAYSGGGQHCIGAIATAERVLALVARRPSDGYGSFHLVLLDADGRLVTSTGVPIDEGAAGAASIASTSAHGAVVVVPTGGPDRPRAYHWFAVAWPDDRLTIRVLGLWSHGQARTAPPIARHGHGETVVAGHDPVSGNDTPREQVGALAYAFGSTYPPAQLATTGLVGTTGFDALPTAPGRAVAAVALGYREVILQGWTPSEQALLGTVTRVPQKVEVGDPRLIERTDGIGVVWHQYNGRIRRTERDATLYLARYDLAVGRLSPPVRLADDRELATGGWHLVGGRRTALLIWKDGLVRAKQTVRLMIFDRLADLPHAAVTLDMPFPDAVVETTRGHLALFTEVSRAPYRWTLRSVAF